MFKLCSAALLACLAASSCGASDAFNKAPLSRSGGGANHCALAAGTDLVAHPSNTNAAPRGHTVVSSSTLRRNEAKQVEGPCADEIVNFIAGQAILSTGASFVIWDDGRVKRDPHQRVPDRHEMEVHENQMIPGFSLVMADQVSERIAAGATHEVYVGLFRGKPGSIIARFDVLDGIPSQEVEHLIRSNLTIRSIDYLPGPDYAGGLIGFVQPEGAGRAWLYSYNWDHSRLRRLKF